MSDSLNILEGITGVLEGFTQTYLPLQKELFKKRLNSISVDDFEKLTGSATGLDKRKMLSESEIELERDVMKEKSAKTEERLKIETQHQNRMKEETFKYNTENKTISTLYPDMEMRPKEFRETGFGELTPEEATSLIKSRHEKSISLSLKEEQNQQRLEKEYRDLHIKQLSNRSGGLGLQDAKVNQAIHLRNLLDQYYDPSSDTYKVPPAQYEELSIGLANLVSGSNVTTESMIDGIRQRTAKGDISGALTYILGIPQSGSTKDVFKNLSDSIDRQGLVSEQLRDKYHTGIRKLAPFGLREDRKQYVEKSEIGSSYKQELEKSPSHNKPMNPPGFNLSGSSKTIKSKSGRIFTLEP